MHVCLQSAVCMYVIKMDTPLRRVSGLITVCDSPPRHPFFADMSKPTSTPVCYVTQSGVVGNHHVCLPSILSTHASITSFPAPILQAEHHDTICSYYSRIPFTYKGAMEMHKDEFPPPVGPNPSTAAPH